MQLPTSIFPCPIVEATCEIRFTTSYPEAALPGLLFQHLQASLPSMVSLPAASIPQEVRRLDPQLSQQALYRFDGDNITALVGASAIGFTTYKYNGWIWFREQILNHWEKVVGSGVPTSIQRIGLRYVDFFELDIFEKTNVKFLLNSESLVGEDTFLKTGIKWRAKNCILQIGKDVRLNVSDRIGSVIDTDVYEQFDNLADMSTKTVGNFLDEAHDAGKDLFFSMLDGNFLATLKPTYSQQP